MEGECGIVLCCSKTVSNVGFSQTNQKWFFKLFLDQHSNLLIGNTHTKSRGNELSLDNARLEINLLPRS